MNEKILLVDDEANVLNSYQRQLRRLFNIHTALSGPSALELVATNGPFAVVVSDLKMPGMDGIEFLSRVKSLAPDAVRILLTGHASLDAAIESVNSGYVFRFLTKPCSMEKLIAALEAGLSQYRLIQAEREFHGLKKIKTAMEGIITGFIAVVEARDPYTAGHQHRVAYLSTAIGEKMGLDQDQLTGLRMAAMVHDIGKIYVPAEFLNRPGKLTEAEFSVIKSHPQVGQDILKSVDFTWPISTIVYQHHERMDGSGYPGRLAGEDILLEARIVAVADVVEAMSSHRPYRPSLGLEIALAEIEKNSGKLYDPVVARVCVELFRRDGLVLEV